MKRVLVGRVLAGLEMIFGALGILGFLVMLAAGETSEGMYVTLGLCIALILLGVVEWLNLNRTMKKMGENPPDETKRRR